MKTKFVMAATVLAVGVAVVLVALVAPGSGGERSVVAQTPPKTASMVTLTRSTTHTSLPSGTRCTPASAGCCCPSRA